MWRWAIARRVAVEMLSGKPQDPTGPRTWRVGRTKYTTGGSAARGGAEAARMTARKRSKASG